MNGEKKAELAAEAECGMQELEVPVSKVAGMVDLKVVFNGDGEELAELYSVVFVK